jgi:hypothetical protein
MRLALHLLPQAAIPLIRPRASLSLLSLSSIRAKINSLVFNCVRTILSKWGVRDRVAMLKKNFNWEVAASEQIGKNLLLPPLRMLAALAACWQNCK